MLFQQRFYERKRNVGREGEGAEGGHEDHFFKDST